VTFALNAANGAVRLTPTAQLYGGRLAGQIALVVEGDSARMTFEQRLTDVNIAALGQDLLGSQDITGTGNVSLNLVAQGSNLGAIRRDLDGDVGFAVKNGSLEGFDFWYELRRARARIDGTAVPDRGDAPRRTTFSSLSASGVVKDALLTNNDLNGTLDFMSIDGSGTVNLLDDAINFDLTAKLVDGPVLQSDPGMAKMAGDTLPLKVTGTIDAPSVLPDFNAIVRQQVEQEVDEAVEEKKEEVREELRDRLRGIFNR
jgi:AsmA protein